eukprot:61349_1
MASSSNTNTNAEHTPKKRRLSHLTTHYDYSSPIFRQAEKPLYAGQHTAPLDFKYHPILFNYHLMYDVYHDTCWAIKHKDITAKQWNLHLNTPHNYPCINAPHCPLQFVEQTHLQKHIPICKASQLLMATRKERSKDIHKNLINFPKQIQKKTLHKERVWITSYPDQSYVCEILIPDDDFLNRKDPSYMDPKNHPPIAINECFFGPVASSEEVKEQKQNTPPAPPPSVHELKPKPRRITLPNQVKQASTVQTRSTQKVVVQSSSSDELQDSDTESSTSSASDTDSSTQSDVNRINESTDSEHDNHQHTHAHNNNVSHVIHTTHNNHNNTNNGRILQAIHTTNHHYDGTNEHKAQSSDDESSFASFPTHGTMSMPTFASFPIHLPNLNAFPLQTSASVEAASNGTKRKAEALNDTDGLIPPHQKQKLNPYRTTGIPIEIPKHNENRNEDRPKRVSNRRQQKQYNTQKQHLNTDEFRSHGDNTEHGRNKRMNPQNIQDTRDRNHIQTNTKPDSFYDTQQTTVICTDIKSKPISAPPLQSKDSKISIKEDKSHLDQLNDMKAHVKMEHKHNVQHQEDVMIIKEIKPEVEENVVILKTDEDVVDEMDKDEIMFVKCRENNKTLTGTPCVDLCRVNDPEYILKFCPDAMCKKEFYRSRKDIREKCSIMICREAIHQDWVYWCWNCGHIVPTRYISWSTEPSAMCPGCRAKRRNKTKCKKENIGT